ncbi:MAG: nucleotidyltransferase domain-containing protein [Candidatus Thorarchaeota archaeon]|nr:nucleotidyltransferase domain-containing protein [Candidatus Thorarchaeota archaeon]
MATSETDLQEKALVWIRDGILEVAGQDIELIVVFGSRARQQAHRLSDTDVAIKTSLSNPETRGRLRLKLISNLAGPDRSVDLIILDEADWSLKYRIARDGVVLFDRGDVWSTFVEEVLRFFPDYRIFESRFLCETLEGE